MCPGAENAAESSDAPFDVLLTCYTLFERDSYENKRDRMFLKKWNWSCMVLDEAHAVKNRSAARTERLNRRVSLQIFLNFRVQSSCSGRGDLIAVHDTRLYAESMMTA